MRALTRWLLGLDRLRELACARLPGAAARQPRRAEGARLQRLATASAATAGGHRIPILAGADAAYLKKALDYRGRGAGHRPRWSRTRRWPAHFGVDDHRVLREAKPRQPTPVKVDPAAVQRGARWRPAQCAGATAPTEGGIARR